MTSTPCNSCRPVRRWLAPCLWLLALPLAQADGGAPASAAQALRAIEQSIGEARCDSTADCRVVGIGAKSCGGPERYLPWSVRDTEPAELERRVIRHREARQAENRREGRVSNCAVTPVPGTSCVAGQCRVQATLPAQ